MARKRSVLTIFIRFFPPDAMLVLYNQRFSHHFHTQLTSERKIERGGARERQRERELGKCLITSWAIRTQFEQISQNENAWENGQVNTCVAHTHIHVYTQTHTASVIQFYLRAFWAKQRNTKTNDFLLSTMYKTHKHTHYRCHSYYIYTINNIQYTHTHMYIPTHTHVVLWLLTKSFAYIFIVCCETETEIGYGITKRNYK